MSKSKIFHYGYAGLIQFFEAESIIIKGRGIGIQNHLRNIAINEGIVSLATPQIGQFWKAFVILKKQFIKVDKWKGYSNLRHTSFDAYLNPRIIDLSTEMCQSWEQCCGYPGIKLLVPRSKKIKIEYCTQKKLQIINEEIQDFKARIFQHQFDHIECIDPLKLANKIEILEEDLRKQHGEMIQTLFAQMIEEREKWRATSTNPNEILKNRTKFNELRRQIAYCVIDKYRK